MTIQRETDIAVRVLQHIGVYGAKSSAGIAEALGVSQTIVFKIAKALKRTGIVSVRRGREGCYGLAVPFENIRFYDVYVAIEGEMTVRHCKKGKFRCDRRGDCKVLDFLTGLQEIIIGEMRRQPIAGLVDGAFYRPRTTKSGVAAASPPAKTLRSAEQRSVMRLP